MIHRILVNPGTPQAWEVVLRPGVNRIGSSAESDFAINHPSISPKHCEVLVSDAGVLLKDIGSKDGTFVDSIPIREMWLQSGQHIQLGAVSAIYESHQTSINTPAVNQAAPGATIVVAAIGSPPATVPFPSGIIADQTETDVPSSETLPGGNSEPVAGPKQIPLHLPGEREVIRRKQFILGLAGAVAGTLVGVLAWFLLIKSTGSPLLVIAWGVGGLTGLGASLLAKRGGVPLGLAAASCAFIGIIGGERLAAHAMRSQEAAQRSIAAYRSELELAKAALRADSPEEFRKLLAQINQKSPEDITDEQIKSFQDEEMPRWRDFALGKPSREEFTKEMESKFVDQFDYKEFLFKEDVRSGLFMVLFAILGIATAYKVGSGKSADQPDDARD